LITDLGRVYASKVFDTTSTPRRLYYQSWDRIDESPVVSGTPRYFTRRPDQALLFYPTPDDAYTLRLDYLREGSEMQHCIGSYAQSGEYMAFKVEGRGERATLGLRVTHGLRTFPDGCTVFDQLHGLRNGVVSGCMNDAAEELVYTLRKENSMLVMQTAGHCV
jgi:hypothetical protein